jgi:hypothetical protein
MRKRVYTNIIIIMFVIRFYHIYFVVGLFFNLSDIINISYKDSSYFHLIKQENSRTKDSFGID